MHQPKLESPGVDPSALAHPGGSLTIRSRLVRTATASVIPMI